MKLAVLYSGGKDSNLALYYALRYENVKCLISIFSKNPHSFMFHTPNIELVKLQAEAIDLPLIIQKTKGEKEIELKDLKKAIKKAKEKYKVEGIVTGAVKSVYQASRIQKICKALDLWCFNPLWLKQENELLKEIKKAKFNVIVSGVFAWPLSKKHVGKKLFDVVKELEKHGISKIGEGGEIETTVLDAIFFRKKIEIVDAEIFGSNNTWFYKIKKAKLIEK